MEFHNKTEFIDANLSRFYSFNLHKCHKKKCMQMQDNIDQKEKNEIK